MIPPRPLPRVVAGPGDQRQVQIPDAEQRVPRQRRGRAYGAKRRAERLDGGVDVAHGEPDVMQLNLHVNLMDARRTSASCRLPWVLTRPIRAGHLPHRGCPGLTGTGPPFLAGWTKRP